jgi:hypothetical protein
MLGTLSPCTHNPTAVLDTPIALDNLDAVQSFSFNNSLKVISFTSFVGSVAYLPLVDAILAPILPLVKRFLIIF